MERFVGYPYVFRVLGLPVESVQVAFDTVWQPVAGAADAAGGGPLGGGRPLGAARAGPTGHLRVADRPIAPGGGPPGSCGCAGRWGDRVRVELALHPWSASRSELGLTALPGPRPAAGPYRQRVYLDAAHRALDQLTVALDDACTHWVDLTPRPPADRPVPVTMTGR